MRASGSGSRFSSRAYPAYRALPALAAGFLTLLLGACRATSPDARNSAAEDLAAGVVICGQVFACDVDVVRWFEPPYYDAYALEPRFGGDLGGLRYQPGRKIDGQVVAPLALNEVQAAVDLFVLHYDACGTSRRCFEVLHDLRGLSVHFMIDVDGTIYQTLDVTDQAWHARQANARSVGVELAHVGAFEPDAESPLDEWYIEDAHGARLLIPSAEQAAGVRGGQGPYPLPRSARVVGAIQGATWEQPDFTQAQYASLGALTRTLTEALPQLAPRFPRDAAGQVETAVLDEERYESFRGILGHHHISASKRDPGPAFDWERLRAALQGATP